MEFVGIPLVPVVVFLLFLFVFVYGLASGERSHPLWLVSCLFTIGMVIVIGILFHMTFNYDGGKETNSDAYQQQMLDDQNKMQDKADMMEDLQND